MGLFRRSQRESAEPLEDAAEARERGHDGLLTPQVFSVAPVVKAEPLPGELTEEELRATADPEDDVAKELLIERERREQNPDY